MNPLTASCLQALGAARPRYARLFERADLSLRAFVEGFHRESPPALQPPSDYLDGWASRLHRLGQDTLVAPLRARLERSPVVFTANHLCLESMPLTAQSMMVAALGEAEASVLPVEATGLIPADNASFPLGLLLARRREGKLGKVPVLHLPARLRGRLALGLPAFSLENLVRAEAAVPSLGLSEPESEALRTIFQDVLAAPDILGQPAFRDQVSLATPRLWARWFAADVDAPPLAYAPLEALRTGLLMSDLSTPGRPLHEVFFDAALREEVLVRLEGVACCWTARGAEKGSALLWEVRSDGRSSPLRAEGGGLLTREGRRIPFEPDPILEGLATGALVPGIFASFATGLVRGLIQVGGFNQADYLADMQAGLAGAFAATGRAAWAEALETPMPPMLTAGLSGIVVDYPDGACEPAGGIECIACGGLTRAQVEALGRLPLEKALASELPGVARMVLGEAAFQAAGLVPDGARIRASGSGMVRLRLA